jgi:hypothetical protein
MKVYLDKPNKPVLIMRQFVGEDKKNDVECSLANGNVPCIRIKKDYVIIT